MIILLLQILGEVAASVFTFVALMQFVFSSVKIPVLIISVVTLALAIWQPFAYGWWAV